MKVNSLQLYILRRMAEGQRPKQAADNAITVYEHLRRARRRTGAKTNFQLAVLLTRAGLL